MSRPFKEWRTAVAGATAMFAVALSATAHAQEQTTIRWGNTAPASVPHALSKMVSLDDALQKKHGVKLDITDFRGNSGNCMAALIGDSVDVCQTGITTGLSAIAEGGDFKSFAVMGGQVAEIVLGKAALERAKIDPNAPVNDRIAKLKGLQIVGSGPGTPNYLLLDAILKRSGLSLSDIRFRTLVDIAAMNEGVRNAQFDGTFWSVGGMGPALSDKSGILVLSLARGDIPELKSVALTAVFAKTAWIEKNKAAAKRAKEAMKEALAKFTADSAGYPAAYKQSVMPDLNADMWKNIISQNVPAYFPDLNGTQAGWDFWIEPMKAENKPYLGRATHANAFVNLD